MGLFSWITSDTNVSIPHMASGRPPVPVWILLPSGKAAYEPRYGGYGDFAGYDFFEEAARHTLGVKATANIETETLRNWGVSLCYLNDPDPREKIAAKHPGTIFAEWLLQKPEKPPRLPRLVETRVPYSSVPDSKDCPEQGY